MIIEKLGAGSLELEGLPSLKALVLDEPPRALLKQAVNATISTNASGTRNRSLRPLPTAIRPAGFFAIEIPFNVSSMASGDLCANQDVRCA